MPIRSSKAVKPSKAFNLWHSKAFRSLAKAFKGSPLTNAHLHCCHLAATFLVGSKRATSMHHYCHPAATSRNEPKTDKANTRDRRARQVGRRQPQ